MILESLTFWFSSAWTTWLATWRQKARKLSWHHVYPCPSPALSFGIPTDLIQTAFVSLPLVLIGLGKR